MKKRYIVCLNDSTKVQEKLFVEFISKSGLGWWHWLPNVWFISDPAGKLTAGKIRDEMKTIFFNINHLVVELNDTGDTWAGFGPNTEENDMFKWIRKNWKTSKV